MAGLDEDGYSTPEEASCSDVAPRFVTVLGSRVDGDTATVWLLTNDQPPFEDYEVHCVREHGRWHADAGYPFSVGIPDEVVERARRMGWSDRLAG